MSKTCDLNSSCTKLSVAFTGGLFSDLQSTSTQEADVFVIVFQTSLLGYKQTLPLYWLSPEAPWSLANIVLEL